MAKIRIVLGSFGPCEDGICNPILLAFSLSFLSWWDLGQNIFLRGSSSCWSDTARNTSLDNCGPSLQISAGPAVFCWAGPWEDVRGTLNLGERRIEVSSMPKEPLGSLLKDWFQLPSPRVDLVCLWWASSMSLFKEQTR